MLIINIRDNEIIDERERQKNKDRKKQRIGASYSESVRAKWFCCTFKLGFVKPRYYLQQELGIERGIEREHSELDDLLLDIHERQKEVKPTALESHVGIKQCRPKCTCMF